MVCRSAKLSNLDCGITDSHLSKEGLVACVSGRRVWVLTRKPLTSVEKDQGSVGAARRSFLTALCALDASNIPIRVMVQSSVPLGFLILALWSPLENPRSSRAQH